MTVRQIILLAGVGLLFFACMNSGLDRRVTIALSWGAYCMVAITFLVVLFLSGSWKRRSPCQQLVIQLAIAAVVRNNSITRRQAPANIRDAVHPGLMRLERHTTLRDDVAKMAPGGLSS
jgi:hypothetical protein